MSRYAELHCHSNFSFLDGASHPYALVERAVALGYEALAITDHDGFYGAPRFRLAAVEAGLATVSAAGRGRGPRRGGCARGSRAASSSNCGITACPATIYATTWRPRWQGGSAFPRSPPTTSTTPLAPRPTPA